MFQYFKLRKVIKLMDQYDTLVNNIILHRKVYPDADDSHLFEVAAKFIAHLGVMYLDDLPKEDLIKIYTKRLNKNKLIPSMGGIYTPPYSKDLKGMRRVELLAYKLRNCQVNEFYSKRIV